MFGRKPRVKCFNAAYGSGAYTSRADLGYQVVPVAQIVGSVGRCEELDEAFRPLTRDRARHHRLNNIRRLVNQGEVLPPVELYKLKDEYYVVDGNHRVAIAKENDQTYIDAYVIEFLPVGQNAADRLYLERWAFARDSKLKDIVVNRLGGYERLRQEIKEQQAMLRGGALFEQAAAGWYRQVFRPAVRTMQAEHLPERLPGRTLGDLYLDLQSLRAYFRAEEGLEMSWEQLVADLAAMHPLPTSWDRLIAGWRRFVASLRARWHGLRSGELPCSFALSGPNGATYCRRVERMKRGVARETTFDA